MGGGLVVEDQGTLQEIANGIKELKSDVAELGQQIDMMEPMYDAQEEELDHYRQEIISLKVSNRDLKYRLEDLENRSWRSNICIREELPGHELLDSGKQLTEAGGRRKDKRDGGAPNMEDDDGEENHLVHYDVPPHPINLVWFRGGELVQFMVIYFIAYADVSTEMRDTIRSYLDINDTPGTSVVLIWEALKAVLKGQFISIAARANTLRREKCQQLEAKIKELDESHRETGVLKQDDSLR
ncbi:hypothetical protein NDU88_004084 [Pleurodeles waltl]|uniref:Uncharacterized protein n=1 Tax=Pleurodeles waltl TaxID=8319 RepID=A0AAV7WQW2_PLEWA|nr:hypothetical protein NDU88_004084 [Pleurodeles waltl]